MKISKEIQKISLDAAKAIGCYYCGVDVAISKNTKKPYIIEVNSSPGSEGIEEATGSNLVGEFVDYIIDKNNWEYSPTLVGRREMMGIEGVGEIEAKFDTGNMVVNSIHADNFDIKNGKVTWTHGGKKFTNKVIDTVTVLQGAIAADKETRPMIELDIEFLGKKFPKRKFTLDDRSNKGTPVLVGVPFMKEFGFVVDPGKTFIKTANTKRELEERTLTKGEKDKKEKIVKGLKKKAKDFKSRYGDDYKSVMYATATKMAKKNPAEEESSDHSEHRGSLEGTQNTHGDTKR